MKFAWTVDFSFEAEDEDAAERKVNALFDAIVPFTAEDGFTLQADSVDEVGS